MKLNFGIYNSSILKAEEIGLLQRWLKTDDCHFNFLLKQIDLSFVVESSFIILIVRNKLKQ